MADKKISQLTAASTPLAGSEELPIVQSGETRRVTSDNLTVKNVRSNATTGVLQVTGPGAGTTRTMTTPDANFTAARTDAGQTFTGNQTFSNNVSAATLSVGAASPTGGYQADIIGRGRFAPTASNYLCDFISSESNKTAIQVYADNSGASLVVGGTAAKPLSVYIGGSELTVVDTSGNYNIKTGNLIIGTAGKGIDFSATASGSGTMTSELLADYEEGTWTPVANRATGGAITATYDTQQGKYTRVGRMVTVSGLIVFSAVTSQGTGENYISGLPFTPDANGLHAGVVSRNEVFTTDVVSTCFAWGDGKIYFRTNVNGNSSTAVDWKTGYINFTITYFV